MSTTSQASPYPSTGSERSIYESYPSSPIDSPAPRITGDPLPDPISYTLPEHRDSTLKVRALSVRRKSPTLPHALMDHESHTGELTPPQLAAGASIDDRTPTGAPFDTAVNIASPQVPPIIVANDMTEKRDDARPEHVAHVPTIPNDSASRTPHANHADIHENDATPDMKPSPIATPPLAEPARRSSPKEEPTLTDKPSSLLPIPVTRTEKRRRLRGPCGAQCVVQ